MTARETAVPAPPAARGRQDFPDEIRGLALLGIAVVNAPFLATSQGGFEDRSDPASQAAWFVLTWFFLGKFYLLFAFLFGYSATLMMKRGDRADRGRFARRLAGLAVLGAVNGLLIFIGDILVLYSVLGLGLLLLVTRPDRTVLRVAAVAAGAALAWLGAVVALTLTVPVGDEDDLTGAAAYNEAMLGSFGDAVQARWETYGSVLLVLLTLNGGLSLAMFALGLVAGRRRMLADPDPDAPVWRAARRWGLPLGLAGGLAAALLSLGPAEGALATERFVLGLMVGFVSAPALSAGYLGLLVALRARRPGALAVFRPAGRMSLTIYLAESLLLQAVFNGWGLGLFGQVNAFVVLAVAVASWALLDAAAHLWMSRFRQGPLEYLLRWWTYGSRPRGVLVRRPTAVRAGDHPPD